MAIKPTKKKRRSHITPPGVASYTHVFQPQDPMEGSDGGAKYSITLLVDKKHRKDLTEIKEAVVEAGEKKFGAEFTNLVKRGKISLPFKDGDEEKEDTEDEALYRRKIYFTAKSSTKPSIVDTDLEPILDDTEFYSGCICRISVVPFAYDKRGNKGVSLLLNNIQKLKDGTRLSGKPAAEEEFEAIDDDDDDDDSDLF
jgi:hypothetical protein